MRWREQERGKTFEVLGTTCRKSWGEKRGGTLKDFKDIQGKPHFELLGILGCCQGNTHRVVIPVLTEDSVNLVLAMCLHP